MLKHDNAKVLEGSLCSLYRGPGHEARSATPPQSFSVTRDAAGWSSVMSRLHAERAEVMASLIDEKVSGVKRACHRRSEADHVT